MFLDATYCTARVDRRVVSQAVVVATRVAADGRREVLGFDVGDSEHGASWTAFLRLLKARGLHGVQLVISDAHAGLKPAIEAVLLSTGWQPLVRGCRVHFLRNLLALVPKGHAEMVAAAVRTIFAQPDAEHVRSQLDVIATMLGRQFPKVEALPPDAADDLTAFADFPSLNGRQTRASGSTGRSDAAPTSSASSPTPPPCSASPTRSWSRPTTEGRSPTAATSLKAPWPCSSNPNKNSR